MNYGKRIERLTSKPEIDPDMITFYPTPGPKHRMPENWIRPKGKQIKGQPVGNLMIPRHGGY